MFKGNECDSVRFQNTCYLYMVYKRVIVCAWFSSSLSFSFFFSFFFFFFSLSFLFLFCFVCNRPKRLLFSNRFLFFFSLFFLFLFARKRPLLRLLVAVGSCSSFLFSLSFRLRVDCAHSARQALVFCCERAEEDQPHQHYSPSLWFLITTFSFILSITSLHIIIFKLVLYSGVCLVS